MGALIAGAKYRGEFEERLKAVLQRSRVEVRRRRCLTGEITLFIDEIHTVVGAGKGEGSIDAGNLLKPALARGQLRCIGATTLDEYRQYIEKDAALERRFQQVFVAQPSVQATTAILRGLKERYEVHHGVTIDDSALVAAAALSDRYIPDRFLPDKAIDLVDEAAAKLKMDASSRPAGAGPGLAQARPGAMEENTAQAPRTHPTPGSPLRRKWRSAPSPTTPPATPAPPSACDCCAPRASLAAEQSALTKAQGGEGTDGGKVG